MCKELWKDITGYKNLYQVSNHGRVKSLGRTTTGKNKTIRRVKPRFLKIQKTFAGYGKVTLVNRHRAKKQFFVHRLVAREFCKNYKKTKVVNHIDHNKFNNYYKNLEWISVAENNRKSLINSGPRVSKGFKYTNICKLNNCDCVWKSVEGYNGFYEVSACGKVRSYRSFHDKEKLKNPRLLNASINYGYLVVKLTDCETFKDKPKFIHRLVASEFIENKNNKPFVNHKDGNRTNNSLQNLEWVNASENALHSVKILGNTRRIDEKTAKEVVDRYINGETLSNIAKSCKVVESTIHRLVKKAGVKRKNLCLSEEQIQSLQKFYRETDCTLSDLYKIYDIPNAEIRKHIRDIDIRNKNCKLTLLQKEAIVKKRRQGESLRSIAKDYNVSHVTIYKIIPA